MEKIYRELLKLLVFGLKCKRSKFLLSLNTFWRILSCTKSLSYQLQSRQMDLAKAADLVTATISTLKEFRNDSQWNRIYKYVQDIANLHGISEDFQRPCRHKQTSQRLQDGIMLESTGMRTVSPSLCEHFKTTLYLPVLDAMLSELEQRFTNKNLMHMRAVQACAPPSPLTLLSGFKPTCPTGRFLWSRQIHSRYGMYIS